MKLEKFKIIYKPDENHFIYNDITLKSVTINLKNQNNLNLYCQDNLLIFNIDFFLVENIFFWFDFENQVYIFTNYSDETWNIDKENFDFFNKNGYYPLSKSYFKNKRVLLSFLRYEFGKEIKVSSLLSVLSISKTENKNTFNNIISKFQYEIYIFLDTYSASKYVLPLSGGIDSRLLFDFFKDLPELYVYTHGELNSGDVIISKLIAEKYQISNYKIFDLKSLNDNMINRNIKRSDFFLPVERVLYPIPEDLFEIDNFIVISGLYGDVVFSDKNKKVYFDQFLNNSVGSFYLDNLDLEIIKCYSQFRISEKLALILLRCQKMTKQSLNMCSHNIDCFIPFLKNSILIEIENYNGNLLYKKIVKKLMNKELRKIIHQTSLSIYTYPEFIRFLQKVFFKFVYKKYSKPYFSEFTFTSFKNKFVNHS